MDINNLQRTPSYSYRVDADKIKQRFQQADKNRAAEQRQGDSVGISEEGRSALREKMSAIGRSGLSEDIGKRPSINSGIYGMMNDFEKIMSELNDKFEEKEGTKTDTFDSYVNKMASAYQLMKDRIEEKYAAFDGQKEYYTAEDGSIQELTKEKELEMLDSTYETHSRFMATNTQIWSELQGFKAQIVYHSGGAETEPLGAKNESAGVKEQAYNAFMAAINEKNVGISSSARNVLNSVWDYYASLKH